MRSLTKNRTDGDANALTPRQTLDVARGKVRDLLLKSDAFRALPQDKQRDIAKNTVEVVNYLAAPEGVPGNKLATAKQFVGAGQSDDPYALALEDEPGGGRRSRRDGDFSALAAREGAQVAGLLLDQVNFPEFVSGLINGVFHSIVQSSMQQMEAYGRLVADVAKSLNQFRDENVSMNQGRDHLVEQFSDTFMLDVDTGDSFGGGGGPRIRLREDVDEEQALAKINDLPVAGGKLTSLDLEDDEVEEKLVQAARTQLATSRQQLLATMVMMGINRIIVTEGRISAKVMYDFRARDNFQRSATSFDYDNLGTKTVREGEHEYEREGSNYTWERDGDKSEGEYRGPSYYSKGQYKTTQEPLVKLKSATAEAQDAQLQSKASLAGTVDVNFKSETFPLEKLADSFQIAQIQNAAQPKRTAPQGGSRAASEPPSSPSTPAT